MKKVTIEIDQETFEFLNIYYLHSCCDTLDDAILEAIRDASGMPGMELMFGNLSGMVGHIIDAKKIDSEE